MLLALIDPGSLRLLAMEEPGDCVEEVRARPRYIVDKTVGLDDEIHEPKYSQDIRD